MATATEISTKALKRIRVIASGETPSAAETQDAIDALNAMIASWGAEGLSGDPLPLDAKYEAGIIAMLAVRLAPDYGKQPDAVLTRDANNGWRQLQAAFITPSEPVFDWALIRTPSRRFPYTYPLDGTIPWRAYTSFSLANYVTNAGNVYICIQAGISGSNGPTATVGTVADGTCVWEFVEPIGST